MLPDRVPGGQEARLGRRQTRGSERPSPAVQARGLCFCVLGSGTLPDQCWVLSHGGPGRGGAGLLGSRLWEPHALLGFLASPPRSLLLPQRCEA